MGGTQQVSINRGLEEIDSTPHMLEVQDVYGIKEAYVEIAREVLEVVYKDVVKWLQSPEQTLKTETLLFRVK